MPGVNRAVILGNLGKDPEIKTLQDGTKLANFSVATSETWRDKNSGEKKEKTEWHRITVWGENLVRVVEQYVRKGDKIYIEGKIETRKWQNQSGQDQYSTEIVVKGFGGTIQLLGDRRDNGARSGSSSGRLSEREPGYDDGYQQPASRPSSGPNSDLDDEIPF